MTTHQQQQPRPAGVSAQQLARYGELLHRRAYAPPEGLDDDRPRHFDGSPTWADLLGKR